MTTLALPSSRLRDALMRPRGDARWDLLLRGTAVAGLLGIPLVLLVPESVVYVWLAVLSLPANSPLSPVLPTFFEPLIVQAAQWKPAWAVTLVGTAGYMYMEYLNWHVYARLLEHERLDGVRGNRWVTWGVARFARAPFWTTALFAFTPAPFWAARAFAILQRYPVRRFMAATLVGRLPRWYLYALFGSLVRVPTWVILAVMLVPAMFLLGGRVVRAGRPGAGAGAS